MDRLSKAARSKNMAAIKSKNTKPELFIFGELQKRKLRFKKHYNIPGKPDIAFPKEKVAIFVNGEFWHGRRFSDFKDRLPEFWLKKIGENIKRDRKNYRLLKNNAWKIILIWDKDLKRNPEKELNKIMKELNQG